MSKEEQNSKISFQAMLRFYKVPAMAGLAVVVLLFLGWKQINGIMDGQRQLIDYKKQVVALDERLVILRNQADGGLMQAKKVADRALPEGKPVFEAFTGLTALAGETGVVVNELTSAPGNLATESGTLNADAGRNGGARSMRVKLKVEGEELAVNNYLTQVIRMVPLIDLDIVKLSASSVKEGEVPRYWAEVELSVYWMPVLATKNTKGQNTAEMTPEQERVVQELLGYKYYGIN